jgi:hypothetical protein
MTLELLNGCKLPEHALLHLMDLLPRISCLRAPNFVFDEQFLVSIHAITDRIRYPTLKHMELGNCYFSDASLLKLMRARMPIYPLQHISAHILRPMELDIAKPKFRCSLWKDFRSL